MLVSAFYDGARGEVILVGVKQGGPGRVQIQVTGSDRLPAHWNLYQTTRQLNCVKTDEITRKDAALGFDLPDESIFTLVGKVNNSEPARRE
jgi:hypothetical protein